MDDVRITGESAESVIFKPTKMDNDLVVVYGDDVTIEEVTLDTREMGQAALVQADANRMTVRNSIIHGGDKIFTVFFAGPDVAVGKPTVDAYESGSLSEGNRILNNQITSQFVGDSVSFSLQKNGEFSGNTVEGGMLAIYMCKSVLATGNTIIDSKVNGVHISIPGQDIRFSNNRLRNSHFAAVTIKPQIEHDFSGRNFQSTGIILENNILRSQYHGIEVDGDGGDASRGVLKGLHLLNNEIRLSDFAGILALRTVEPLIEENTVIFANSDPSRRGVDGRADIPGWLSAGIFLDVEVPRAELLNNTITRAKTVSHFEVAQNAVGLNLPTVTGAKIKGNSFNNGAGEWYHSPCSKDFGGADRDGIYDRTGQSHDISGNICKEVPGT